VRVSIFIVCLYLYIDVIKKGRLGSDYLV